ncbi:MAG: tRNA uridine-5-carboxymethylaminomethyl(34) synthesis enzyme MnmG [Schleiferiaceae bacterium]
MKEIYDVIVVGGGHAGCEAAAAAANLGSKTLLITMNLQTIGQMSCNPAMGGVAKGQIVREIDALGGYSGLISDKTALQFRMLNRSKGPAMWSPRVQSDRWKFAEEWRLTLESLPNLDFFQDMVTGLLVEDGKAHGVTTGIGKTYYAHTIVLTNGTFLNGLIHIGEKNFGGGRAGERAATGITKDLVDLGFEYGRMKTGTPPRVDGRSLDYSKFEEQKGDERPGRFSYREGDEIQDQMSCWIAYTNPDVHDSLKEGFDRSPMFNGSIKSIGPRYCPSIEDKINRFADKDRHQLFVEPEARGSVEMYINGFSTSLPEEVQYESLRKVPGFENVKFFRPGYAIEYDYFPPTQLNHTLETKLVENLYFAGQINGTTGYEEAACQGLIAGINAANKLNGKDPFILDRDEAYIGVLIDDLITKGTEEPYRMFTSRAEYRLLLRQDNADIRLTRRGYELGLASKERLERLGKKEADIKVLLKYFQKTSVSPEMVNPMLEAKGSAPIKQKLKAHSLVSRPNIYLSDFESIPEIWNDIKDFSAEVFEQVEIDIKYSGYINKEKENVEKSARLSNLKIPSDFDYFKLGSLSMEARQKLDKIKPVTLAQASRISGVSPSDINVLMVFMGR